MEERLKQIQTEFKGISGSIYLYMDGISFKYIDVDSNMLEGYKTIIAGCGCCSDNIDHDFELSYELEYMDELDFKDLIDELNRLKII